MRITVYDALIVLAVALAAQDSVPPSVYGGFHKPEPVTIEGYFDEAMEPFITRDGRFLLFNNRNDPGINTNLHYAERINDVHFIYRGEIRGVNTAALEGAPSLSCDGTLYFVSTRSYAATSSSIYRAHFADGAVDEVRLAPGVSRAKPGWVNFDVEVSASGDTLYAVDSRFRNGAPAGADLFIARRHGAAFERDPNSDRILRLVNSEQLEYAPAISSDELELFFARVAKIEPGAVPRIWRSVRSRVDEPFGTPQLVGAIEGFAEGPSLSPDGLSLYYHARVNGRFSIFRVTRTADGSEHRNGCNQKGLQPSC